MIVDNLFMTSFCNLVVMTKGRVGVPSTRFQVGRINPCRVSVFNFQCDNSDPICV